MKTKLQIIIVFLLISVSLSITASETASEKDKVFLGKVTGNGIRVRADKNTSAKILGNLYKGEKVKVLARSENKEKIQEMEEYWYKIEYKSEIGWTYGYYLIVEEPVENFNGIINANNVHVRREFGLGTEIIGRLFQGDKLKIVSKTNKKISVDDKSNYWFKVVLPDNTFGWIFGDFIDLTSK